MHARGATVRGGRSRGNDAADAFMEVVATFASRAARLERRAGPGPRPRGTVGPACAARADR